MPFRTVSLAVAGALVSFMLVEVRLRPSPEDAAPFHQAAASAIKAVPYRLAGWDGVDTPIPASAQALLRPNATLARVYTDSQTGRRANVIIVQCADTRDMAGHYPPICYPSSGWEKSRDPEQVPIHVGTKTLRVTRYQFRRPAFDHDLQTVVYGFFAVPGGDFPPDMEKIRSLAADYTARPFGAAQIQVVLGQGMERDEEVAVVQTLLSPLEGVLDLLVDPAWRRQ